MIRLPSVRHRLGTAIVLAAALSTLPAVANAHSELASASPAPNGSVVAAPVAVTITFTEAVEPASASIELLDSQGRIVPGVGGIVVSPDGRTAGVSLPDLGPGVYTVSYRVVSTVDGHATDGSYAFLVDPTGAAPPPADSAEATSPSVDPLTVAARWLGLAAMLVAIGAMASWRLTARPVLRDGGLDDSPPWHLVSLSALAGAAGVIGYLLLAARPLAGSGGTGIPLDPAAAFGWSPFAIAMRVGIGCLVAAGLMAWRGGGRRRASIRPGVVLALLAVAAGAMSLAGHLASSGGAIGAILDAGHQLAVATWLGALPAALVLGARAGDRRRTTLRILRAHGPVALVAAPVVVLTGLAGSAVVLGSRRDLIGTDYGNVLLAKVLLLAVALAIGAVNHFTVRGRGRAAVMALVGAELVAGAGAVGLAATMVTIQPASARPATVAASPVRPAHVFGVVGPSRVHVAVSLPAPGTQSYRVTVRDAISGLPRDDVQGVFLAFTPPPSSDLPPERIRLADEGDGVWSASGAYTPIPGTWALEAAVRRVGAPDDALAFDVDVLDLEATGLVPPPDTGVGVPGPIAATWSLLPAGPPGWLPGAGGLVVLAALWRRRRTRATGFVRGAALVLVVLGTAAAGSRDLVAAANAPPMRAAAGATPAVGPADPDRGRTIYLANCASCHGAQADGNGVMRTLPEAGALRDAVREASDAALSYRIANGIAGTPMPPFAGLLTADERADLIAYLRLELGSQ